MAHGAFRQVADSGGRWVGDIGDPFREVAETSGKHQEEARSHELEESRLPAPQLQATKQQVVEQGDKCCVTKC